MADKFSRGNLTVEELRKTNTKQTKNMNLELKEPNNLLIVAGTKGGIGKTAFTTETHAACKLRNIPSIVCTFDKSNDALVGALRDEKLVRKLAMPDGSLLLDTFGAVTDEARDTGAIITLDMPPGFNDPDHPLTRALTESTILGEFDTISVLIPIKPDSIDLAGAFDALAVFERIGMRINHGLVRAWNNKSANPNWESYPAYQKLASMYPVWECGTWMSSMSEMIQQRGAFADFPAIHLLPAYFQEKSAEMSTQQRGALRGAVAHLERANNAIYESILKHITRPVPIAEANLDSNGEIKTKK
jgi:hypothetical protein